MYEDEEGDVFSDYEENIEESALEAKRVLCRDIKGKGNDMEE